MDASTLIAGGLCGGSATNEPHEVSKPSIAADRPTRRQVGNVTKVQKKSKRKSKAKAKIRAQGKHQSKKESIASAILCAPSPFRRDQFALPGVSCRGFHCGDRHCCSRADTAQVPKE